MNKSCYIKINVLKNALKILRAEWAQLRLLSYYLRLLLLTTAGVAKTRCRLLGRARSLLARTVKLVSGFSSVCGPFFCSSVSFLLRLLINPSRSWLADFL